MDGAYSVIAANVLRDPYPRLEHSVIAANVLRDPYMYLEHTVLLMLTYKEILNRGWSIQCHCC